MGRRARIAELEDRIVELENQNGTLSLRASDAEARFHRACKGWDHERGLYEADLSTKKVRIAAVEAENAELREQRDEAHRIVRLLAGKLLGVGFLDEKGNVTISETRARRIMADERRPAVMHDQLTGKTVVRLVEPGNPRPWDEVPR